MHSLLGGILSERLNPIRLRGMSFRSVHALVGFKLVLDLPRGHVLIDLCHFLFELQRWDVPSEFWVFELRQLPIRELRRCRRVELHWLRGWSIFCLGSSKLLDLCLGLLLDNGRVELRGVAARVGLPRLHDGGDCC